MASTAPAREFTAALLEWYGRHRRDLPWRRTTDPYAILVSEVMLQQTRVETVIPYYERFLRKFPDLQTLASAPEFELLAAWAGLGYYSRARNLQRAAKAMVEGGGVPSTYQELLKLPGIGAYTAAAVASIAFGQPEAVLDGNVMRVMARIAADVGDIRSSDTRGRLQRAAAALIDSQEPGAFNQAVMELGATICSPADPKCLLCPVRDCCRARALGRERDLPVKSRSSATRQIAVRLFVIEQEGKVLLWRRGVESKRLAGFWELPDDKALPNATILEIVGQFRHTITNTRYTFTVQRASMPECPNGFEWVSRDAFAAIPLSTTARKAMRQCG